MIKENLKELYMDIYDNGIVNNEYREKFKHYVNTTVQNLVKELKNERKINEEIKARFVKCNTCTQEMKDKCLMFTENLCEGERCEELVDIMSLVEKRESDDRLKLAKDIIKKLVSNAPDTYCGTDIELQQSKMFAFSNALNEACDFLKE